MCGCCGGGATQVTINDLNTRTNLDDFDYEDLLTDEWEPIGKDEQTRENLDKINAGFWARDVHVKALSPEERLQLYGDYADHLDNDGDVDFTIVPKDTALNGALTV